MELLLFAGLIVVGVLIIRVGIKRSRQEGAGERECQGRHRGTSTETERPSRSLPPKPHACTMQEYARQYPQIGRFAALYTVLRYRSAFDPRERSRTWQELRTQYRSR